MTDYFTPEKDVTYTQADGCDVLVAAKGIPIPLATARAMGLVPAEDAQPIAPKAPTEPPTGDEEPLPPDETATLPEPEPAEDAPATLPEPEPAEDAPAATRRKAKASEA